MSCHTPYAVVCLVLSAVVMLATSCKVNQYAPSVYPSAASAPYAAPEDPVASGPFSEGTLYVAKDGASTALPLEPTQLAASVAGEMISADVTQRFGNPYAERIEATYVFPLPNHAAVDAMEMHIGSRVVRADVRPRGEARAAYEAAAAQGQHAALLEQERPNIFTFSVANIEPGAGIEVKLHYFEVARYDHGTYEMAFPMVVGPRYIPGSVSDADRITTAYVPPSTRSGHTVGVAVHLDAGSAIDTVQSAAHEIDVARPSPASADVTLRSADEIPNRDFVLRWRTKSPTLETALFVSREGAARDGYLALMLEPKHDPKPAEIAPRELFFLLDTSGSMEGTPLDTSVKAVLRAVDAMYPSDTFQIIDFADTASAFADEPLANTPENVARAHDYLKHLAASGGTNQLAGIHAALTAKGDDARLRYVMFMTDGYIGNEADVVELVRREVGSARIFGFGVGSSPNRYLLDEVSYVGRGAAEYIRGNEDPRALVERFYARIGQPYLTDIGVDWGGLAVTDAVPGRIPDLSTFQPLVVLARYREGGEGTVTVRGRLGGKAYEQKLSVSLPETAGGNVAVARLWAREEIAGLTREEPSKGSQERAITAIALEHHLVTQYTSLVAIDTSDAPRPGAAPPVRVEVPAEAPQGVNLQTAGGQIANPKPAAQPTSGGTVAFASATPMTTPAPAAPPTAAEPVSNADVMEETVMAEPATSPPPPASHRAGACAGCAAAPQGTTPWPACLLLLGVALVARRFRR